MRYARITTALLLIVATLGFDVAPAFAAVGDARIQYGTGTNATPQTRFYTNSTNTWGAAGATVAGTANVGWVVSKESPTADVTVVATQSTTGVLDVFCRSGSTWTKDFTVTIGSSAATRRFDVEFEKTTGIPMVVYSKNVATTNEIGYRRKTGAGCGAAAWSAESLVNPTRVTGIVLWMELEARQVSGTNVMAMAFSDSSATNGGILEAMIWDGTSWANESPAAAANGWSDSSIELQGAAGANAAKVFDLAFETTSGDLIVGWGTSLGANGTNGFRYATCVATLPCTWSGVLTPSGPIDDATMVAAAPDPGSDAVAFISIGNAGSDLQAWLWNGTAVGATAANADTSTAAPAAGQTLVDIDWVVSGTQRMAVGVYADSASPVKYIYYDTVGAAWRTNGSAGFSVTGAPATVPNQIEVRANPANTSQLLLNFTDTASDLWSKRLAYNGAAGGATTALATWSNSDGGVALDLSVSSITAHAFGFDWVRFAATPVVTLASAGTQTANLDSSDTGQYIGAAFTLQQDSGTADTVTAMTVSETGTVSASTTLSNATLRYETGVSSCTYNGTETIAKTGVTFNTSDQAAFTALTSNIPLTLAPNFTCVYLVLDLKNGTTYPSGGQTIEPQVTASADFTLSGGSTKAGTYPVALGGTTTVRPKITSYTNTTETGLNYAASCTGCGARIGGGAGFRQTIVIDGFGFGTAGAGSRANCAGAVNTGCVQVAGGSTLTIADANITAWSNIQITLQTDTATAGNADADWGANYGGASALKVTAGGQAVATNLNFYIFPQVTGVRPCDKAGFPQSNNGREYDATDVACPNGLIDGEIFIDGTRFGTSQGTGGVTIVSTTAGISSWANTVIKAQVPTAIGDTVYTGNLIVTQGTGTNGKTHTYTTTGFVVLPRITGFYPTSAAPGAAVGVLGNHFCQNGGTCPVAFDASNKITFTSAVDATTFTSWGHTVATTTVPTGAVTGNVVLKSNGTDSNPKSFTVLSPNPDPPDLAVPRQFKDSGLTQSIAVGLYASSTPLYLTMTMSSGLTTGTLYPQIESKATSTAFTCTGGGGAAGANACASAVEGTGKAASGNPWNCSTAANGCAISISPADGDYHWQARVCRNDGVGTHTAACGGTGDYASTWTAYGGNSDVVPAAIDVTVDTTPPVLSGIAASPSTNSATVTWTTDVLATSRIEYDKAGTFTGGYDCAGTTECAALDTNMLASHSVSLSNLDSGTLYYYRVRSKDAAGNEASSTSNTFTTSSVTQPAKTTRTTIVSSPSAITAATSTYFTALAPETAPKIKSAYVELVGLVSGGSSPIAVRVNTTATSSYAVSAASPTLYRFLYKITDQATDPTPENVLNLNDVTPCTNGNGGTTLCNRLSIDVPAGMTFSILSARFIMTYGYTP